ncbi:tetraspanin-1-like isoform X1 [Malaclemys terrapin pileata]|uniref:tetraspanin-1-like isoform X1 n=2 Tax=Malaclemys terrapin pileata TaxID=2991368 RepID=UPI0023A802B9|nr:tetraspanin-1-like isoform X1 [Malaclemys terrapin pileata]
MVLLPVLPSSPQPARAVGDSAVGSKRPDSSLWSRCPGAGGFGCWKMGCFSFLKMMMFVFNGVIFLSGLAVLGIGIWVKVDGGSFMQILGAAAPQLMQLINVGYLCIAVGTFLLLMGFLGCCGAMKESKCMLLLFFVIILILFIAEVAGAVVVLAFSSVADIFIEHLKNWAVKTLREDYGRQDDVTAIWDTTMKELKCCGFNNYKDFNSSYFYQTHSQTYPTGCCLPPKRECLESELDGTKQGCLHAFQTFLSRNGRIVGGVALGIGVLQLAAMAVSLVLYCQISTNG